MGAPALFRRYPALSERLPHRTFLAGPTPVVSVVLDGLDRPLWVKQDGSSCPLYGGNKPRKLEFLIGDALARGCRRLVTTGGIGTNHGLATTILGREAGLATTLVLVDQPVTEKVRESLLLFLAYGAEVRHGRSVAGTALGVACVLARASLAGERPRRVPTGGTSPLGALGFVSAGLELAEQVKAGECPAPAEVHVAVGTGGSLAGLALGLRLAGLDARLVGVLVTDILPPSEARIARLARRSLALLRRHDPSVPALELDPGRLCLARDQLGPGYGAPTAEAREAVSEATRAGLTLETTYTGKCLAGILRRARARELPDAPVLFWNTYNAVDVGARAPRRASPGELPSSLRGLFETP